MAHWRKQKKKGTGDCFYRIKDFRFKMKFPRTSPICLALGINAFGLSDGREPNNTIYNNAISLFWLSFPLRLGGTKCPARGGKKLVWRTGSGVGAVLRGKEKVVVKWQPKKDMVYRAPARWRLRTSTPATWNVCGSEWKHARPINGGIPEWKCHSLRKPSSVAEVRLGVWIYTSGAPAVKRRQENVTFLVR